MKVNCKKASFWKGARRLSQPQRPISLLGRPPGPPRARAVETGGGSAPLWRATKQMDLADASIVVMTERHLRFPSAHCRPYRLRHLSTKRSAGDRFRGSSEIVERLSQAPRRSTTGMDAKVSSNIRSRRSASPSRTEEPDQDAVGNGFSSVEELREDSSNHDDVIKQEDLEWRAQGTILELFLTNLSVRRSSLSSPSASIFRTLTNGRCRAVHRFNRISRASSRFFYNFTHLPID